MVIKLIQPQELEAAYVLPALRRELARALRAHGVGQKDIAKRLGVTEAAVSQYAHNKRGTDIAFDRETQEHIKEVALRITNAQSLLAETQGLLARIWQKRKICVICQDHNPHIPKTCAVCFA